VAGLTLKDEAVSHCKKEVDSPHNPRAEATATYRCHQPHLQCITPLEGLTLNMASAAPPPAARPATTTPGRVSPAHHELVGALTKRGRLPKWPLSGSAWQRSGASHQFNGLSSYIGRHSQRVDLSASGEEGKAMHSFAAAINVHVRYQRVRNARKSLNCTAPSARLQVPVRMCICPVSAWTSWSTSDGSPDPLHLTTTTACVPLERAYSS